MAKLPGDFTPLPPLMGEQAEAARPTQDAWLSASAGTGKTQVLTARVLRLLLHGARPESILCLTFTKAGAAEMAERIHERLGDWVRLDGPLLAADLKALGEDFGPDMQDRARTLFARVLDARGGGLRIMTIHSFCQALLAGFPAEAGLVPGFRPVEGREEQALLDSALADMVADAHTGGQLGLIERVQALAHRLGEDGARTLLRRCAAAPDAMEVLGVGIGPKVRGWLGLHAADPDALLRAACTDGGFDRAGLERIRDANIAWGTGRGMKKVEAIADWLAMEPEARFAHIDVLLSVWTSAKGEPLSLAKGFAPQDDDYPDGVARQWDHFNPLIELQKLARTADAITDALIVGQAYARTYADAKRAAGVVDFGDMIRATVALLQEPGMGDWIRFKLDQATDHILVDEAQDTNADQWAIVKAMAEEFHAGEGAKGKALRTIFAVGDFKQAIFGFQGTDPAEFRNAREHFAAAASNAERTLARLSITASFRSSQPILDVADAVIDTIGAEAMGLPSRDDLHISAKKGSGSVTLWPPVSGVASEDAEDAEEDWLTDAELAFAAGLARQVKDWTQGLTPLRLRNQTRNATPGDVLILVRSRGDLARLIVSRLYEEGVPVAGVDRLRLDTPIAVQDLLACIRFVLQPEDDLNLAALLVSPLIGWSQDDLYRQARRRKGVSLWQHLGEAKPQALRALLAQADLVTPHRFLQHILSGPMDGRRRMMARLGEEARDPIEELVNQALAFEMEEAPSLQNFIAWFDRGEVEIKRDPGGQGDAVRVMTVHGAKGLQAPIVVLADATKNPDYTPKRDLAWQVEEGLTLPLFRPRSEERVASLKDSTELADRREREEHWRLLYVALTRAEEHLFIGGAMKPKQQKEGLGEDAWQTRIAAAMEALPVVRGDDGSVQLFHTEAEPKQRKTDRAVLAPLIEPDWLRSGAPEEARPPRPLSPSAIEPADAVANPPPGADQRAAAERGTLLHALFERLPGVAPEKRAEAAERWLEGAAGVADPASRRDLVSAALAIIDDPRFAAVFAPDGLSEVPLAGVVAGRAYAGAVDRLLVTDDAITVVDFKTGRRVPQSASDVPGHHCAQMAAYVAVLEGIFPGRAVSAALLYTSGPSLIALEPGDLAPYKPGFSV